jgi:hypoxanthine phosphoribosyltransferase
LIVGIGRGGLIPATLLSHKIKIPMLSYHLSLRDHTDTHDILYDESHVQLLQEVMKTQSVLLVDDINDTGETLSLLENRFPKAFSAVLLERSQSYHKATYVANELKSPSWIVFPWEAK